MENKFYRSVKTLGCVCCITVGILTAARATTVNIDLNRSGSPTYSGLGGAPDAIRNVIWNGVSSSGVLSLLASDGTPTYLEISPVAFDGFMVDDMSAPVAPALLRDYMTIPPTNPQKVTLSGLESGGTYDLFLYGISYKNGGTARFTIGGVSKPTKGGDLATTQLVEGEDYVVFRAVKASPSGTIMFTYSGDFNGLQIQSIPPTQIPAPPHAVGQPARLVWETREGSPYPGTAAEALALDSRGNAVVAGAVTFDGFDSNSYIAKYAAATGKVLWSTRFDDPANTYDAAAAVAVDLNDDVIASGIRGSEFITVKYSGANGTRLWTATSPDAFVLKAITTDAHGDVVIVGRSAAEYLNGHLFTAKYAGATGALIWTKQYSDGVQYDAGAAAVITDHEANVVVTGYSGVYDDGTGNPTGGDYYTVKYAAATGAILWSVRYDGPAHATDIATSAVLDHEGDVVVTGVSKNASGNDDICTVKYAGASGQVLWETRYDDPNNGSDSGWAVTIDSADDVVITGRSELGGHGDVYTAKYARIDGTLIWERRDSDNYGEGRGSDVITTDDNNVVVVGETSDGEPGGGAHFIFYVAKYRGTDGAIMWERKLKGDYYTRATAVGLDRAGNAFVAGAVGDRGDQIYTAKYADSSLVNISTRAVVGTGENTLIGGFIVGGTEVKPVMVRALGPSLESRGITGYLDDPALEIRDAKGKTIATNDDWKDSQQAEIGTSGLAPKNSRESAVINALTPGAYTVLVTGHAEATGAAIVEVYDLNSNTNATFRNISTRGQVGQGDDLMIGGVIVAANDNAVILFRAIGPSLADAGIAGALTDPILELRDAQGLLIAANDDWKQDQESEIAATKIAPKSDAESAIVQRLPAGPCTALVRGKSGNAGVALVEAYYLDN